MEMFDLFMRTGFPWRIEVNRQQHSPLNYENRSCRNSKRSLAVPLLFAAVMFFVVGLMVLIPAGPVLSEDGSQAAAQTAKKPGGLKAFLERKKEEDRNKPADVDQASPEASDFVRIIRDVNGLPQKLQTAITRYEIVKDGQRTIVDLIGAIHVGDRSYYKQLNREFDKYEVVLFELVAPKNVKLSEIGTKPHRASKDPVSLMQRGMQEFLHLEHQLEQVNYNKKHFVHADMSPEQFRLSMKEKGETIFTLMFRMMAAGMAKNGSSMSDMDLILALFDPNRTKRLKQVMAEQMLDVEAMNRGLGGDEGTTLITERNKVALKVLREQMDKGKKHIAIFYGCGHMPDFRDRLLRDFSMHKTKNTWVTAWDMTKD